MTTTEASKLTIEPTAWKICINGREVGCVSEGYDYFFAQWLPYGDGFNSSHTTRDEAIAAVLAAGAE